MISFTQMLIYNTMFLTSIFYILLIIGLRTSNRKPPILPIPPRILKILIIGLLSAYIVCEIGSLLRGYRDPVVFGLMSSLSILIAFCATGNNSTGNAAPILLSLLLVSLSEPLTLYLGNDFYPRWDWVSDTIMRTGHLNEYFQGIAKAGLYYLIPVSYLRQITLALVCQPSYVIPFLNAVIEYLAYVISLYAFFKKSRYGVLGGVLSVLILISSPGDNVLTGRLIGSLIFPFMLSSLIYYRTGWASAMISSLLLMIGMIFQHGSPVMGYSMLFFPIILKGWDDDLVLREVARRVGALIAVLSVAASTYWLYTHIINQASHIGLSFVNSILSYFLPSQREAISPWSYVPRYESGGYSVYSFAWAFPVALSVALLLNYITRMLMQRSILRSLNTGDSSSFLATMVVGASFIAYRIAESGQYFIPVGYFFALIASTIALSRILEGRRLGIILATIALLAIFIYTGISSPSHANLEHPEFESAAQIFRYTRYVEASEISQLLSPTIKVYYDYDLPIGGGIYKTIRERIESILQGIDPRTLEQGKVIYAIKNRRLSGTENIFYASSIIYRSEFYTLFYVVN
jgi:hypothetical protein